MKQLFLFKQLGCTHPEMLREAALAGCKRQPGVGLSVPQRCPSAAPPFAPVTFAHLSTSLGFSFNFPARDKDNERRVCWFPFLSNAQPRLVNCPALSSQDSINKATFKITAHGKCFTFLMHSGTAKVIAF